MPLDSVQMHLQDALSAKLISHLYFQKTFVVLANLESRMVCQILDACKLSKKGQDDHWECQLL